MHGRKGPKADPTVAGTTVKYLSTEAKCPIVIIKDPRTRSIKKDGKYRFGCCFDGSDRSKAALRQVLNMMRPEDNLVIITVKESNIKMELVESQCNSICAEANYSNQAYVNCERKGSETIYDAIKTYLVEESNKDNYVDFVATGNNGVNAVSRPETTLG